MTSSFPDVSPRLNNENIRAALPGATLWDDVVTGLHLRVRGGRNFYLHYRTRDRRARRFKLGSFGELTVSEARARAKALKERVARGEDPKGEWDEKSEELTVEGLWERCYAAHWSAVRYQASGWAREAKRLYETRIRPSFGAWRLSDLTVTRVRDWHARGGAPIASNRALAVLSRMFKYAEEQELQELGTNPCRLVKNNPERKRKRFASEAEIKAIAPLLEKYADTSPEGVAFIYLLMFSGSRPRAIERATWDQLKEVEAGDATYGVLTFYGKSSGKTGQDEQVFLPPQAMRVIARLPRSRPTIVGVKLPVRLWRTIREEAGCPDLWARDWRRTFATVGLTSGIEPGTIGELLNHHSAQTTKRYATLMDTRRVEVASQIAKRMEKLMGENSRDARHVSDSASGSDVRGLDRDENTGKEVVTV